MNVQLSQQGHNYHLKRASFHLIASFDGVIAHAYIE